MRRGPGDAGVLLALGDAAGGGAVAMMVLLLVAGAGHAQPADGRAGAGSTRAAGPWIPAPVAVAVTPGAPLTALSIGGDALTCVQSPLALDAAGRAGVLAPQVGATIIRGSSAPSPSVTWVVVPVNGVAGEGGTVTVCVPIR